LGTYRIAVHQSTKMLSSTAWLSFRTANFDEAHPLAILHIFGSRLLQRIANCIVFLTNHCLGSRTRRHFADLNSYLPVFRFISMKTPFENGAPSPRHRAYVEALHSQASCHHGEVTVRPFVLALCGVSSCLWLDGSSAPFLITCVYLSVFIFRNAAPGLNPGDCSDSRLLYFYLVFLYKCWDWVLRKRLRPKIFLFIHVSFSFLSLPLMLHPFLHCSIYVFLFEQILICQALHKKRSLPLEISSN
jgi:hypothetical protein